MKGIIFTTFSDMVEEQYGLETWDLLVEKVKPANRGAYTAGGTYPEVDLMGYVTELSKIEKESPSALVEKFGEYLFPTLAKKYPIFLPKGITFKEFMKSIDKVIHIEVQKLHPEANLPTMTYEDPAPHKLVILYKSPRKLCSLAIGLTRGAAAHFKVPINICQPVCMLEGANHCRLEIKIGR